MLFYSFTDPNQNLSLCCMNTLLRTGVYGLLFFLLGCKLDDLPAKKSQKICQKPAATIVATVDPADFRKYTFSLSGVTGDVEKVVWTINNGPPQTTAANQSVPNTFAQQGTYPVSVSLQNACNNNTTVQINLPVAPGKPVVVTGQPTGVGTASAAVQLTVTSLNGNPSLSDHGFVYAEAPNTTPTLETGTNRFFQGTPALNSPVSMTLTGLRPGVTYYYRAFVRVSAGAAPEYGNILQFTTTQPTLTTWSRLYGGSGGDQGNSLVALPGGGAMFVGNSNSNFSGDFQNATRGLTDAWVGRVDGSGALTSQWSYGGNGEDNLRSIQATRDGGFILAGTTNSTGSGFPTRGGFDVWVVKINSSGAVQWSRVYGGSREEYAFSVQPTDDGGYIFTGRTSSTDGDLAGQGQRGDFDAWVVKLTSDGTIAWQKVLGGSGYDGAGSVVVTSDGYALAGQSASTNGDLTGQARPGGSDMWVVKLNTAGGIVWQRLLGDSGDDSANSIQQFFDGGFIVAGTVNLPTGLTDGRVYRLSSGGIPVGNPSTFGGLGREELQHVEVFNDGTLLLTGFTDSNTIPGYKGATDAWVVKLKADFSLDWQRAYGGTGIDQGYGIRPTTDGGYILGGISNSNNGDVSGQNKGGNDVFVLKMTTTGTY